MLILLLLLFSFAFSEVLCIKELVNPYPEPYVDYIFRKTVEKAILESGNSIDCGEGSKDVRLEVEKIRENPIAYTSQQRVSAYSMELALKVSIEDKQKSFFVAVPYSQPTGSIGDLPRRGAIEDAFKILYLNILEFIKRR